MSFRTKCTLSFRAKSRNLNLRKHPDQRAEMLERQGASVFYSLNDRKQAHKQEALPQGTVDVAKPHERTHVIVPVDDLLLRLLPIGPVVHRPGLRNYPHLETMIPGPVAPVVVVPVDREQLTEQPNGFQRFSRNQPMRRHNTFDAVILSGAKNLPELPVQGSETVGHLERTQDAVSGVRPVRGDKAHEWQQMRIYQIQNYRC